MGDLDGAIDYYHQSLSRKADDPFSSEMLNRALHDALNGKLFLADAPSPKVGRGSGRKDLNLDLSSARATLNLSSPAPTNSSNMQQSMQQSMMTDDGLSLSVESGDVDMSMT
jgi:hypothetical protein